MSEYEYEVLNFWNDSDDLYVDYKVNDIENDKVAHCIDYFNTSDIGCDYNTSTDTEIMGHIHQLIKKNNGVEFTMPKVSELSKLLEYVYDFVCESDANMCHITYDEWEDLKDEENFNDDDINTLKEEIKKYNLDDYISLDDNEYKIIGYGCLQCSFNDDRCERCDELER